MWLQSVTNQAFSLCAPCVIINDIYPKSGAGTIELLREVAANALEITTDELLGNDIDEKAMTFFKAKTVLARGMESMSEEDKKKLMKFLLENY